MSNATETQKIGAEQAGQFAEQAAALLAELQEQAGQVAAERPELVGQQNAGVARSSSSHTCDTKVVFTGLAIWERVQVCCSSNPPVRTTADIWGPTVAIGGISWGSSSFSVSPDALPGMGELTMQVNIASVLVQISWWKGSSCIGTFVGAGVGVGSAILAGTCTFERGSC
jgi:hypothetical protein